MKKIFGTKAITTIFLFSIGAFFMAYNPSWHTAVLSYVTYPVLSFKAHCISPFKEWLHRKTLAREVERKMLVAHTHYQDVVAELISLHATLEELNGIEELLQFKKRYLLDFGVIVKVLSTHFSEVSHFIFVDAGSVRGIQKDIVVVYKNCIVGRVEHVYPHYSKITLITDRSCKIAAQCMITGAQGIYEGCNQLDAGQLLFVSHLSELKTDDLLISSGEGLVFPRGFGIGRIRAFKRAGLHYSVEVEPLIDITTLSECCIIQPGAEYNLSE